jgi:hypothetical protein
MTHSSFWGLLYIHELSSGVGSRVVTRVVANCDCQSQKCDSDANCDCQSQIVTASCNSVTGVAICDLWSQMCDHSRIFTEAPSSAE